MQAISFAFQILILALPLIFIPNIFNPYEFPKFIFFVTASELLAIFFTLHWLSDKNKEEIFPRMDLGVFFVLCFGIVNLISDLFGINPMTSIWGNNFRHQGFITLVSGMVIFLLLRSPLLFKKILPIFRKTVIASSFLIALFAIWQVIQINIFHNYAIATYNNRIVGTLGNPNFLGGYLAMLLPFVLWYRQKLKQPFNYLMFAGRLFIALSILLTIFYTDSVSSFIAIGFLLIVFLVRLFMKIPLPKFLLTMAFVLTFWIGSGNVANYVFKNTALEQSFIVKDQERCFENWPDTYPLKIITNIRKNGNIFFKRDSPCDSRLLIWMSGLNNLVKRPILGFGQDNFGYLVPQDAMYIVDSTHNIFLETILASGIIGLLFFILILIYSLRKSSFDIKMSLIAFIIVGQFNPLSIVQIALFWILLGLSQKKQRKKEQKGKLTTFLDDRII